jgi:hypothetical protein
VRSSRDASRAGGHRRGGRVPYVAPAGACLWGGDGCGGASASSYAWAGRSLLIRATVIDIRQRFPAVADARVVLTPPLPAQNPQTTTLGERTILAQRVSQGYTLTLITRPPAAPLVVLRRLPVVGRFVSPPQRGSTFGSGAYRIQLASVAQSCLPLRLHRLSRAALLKTAYLPHWRGCYDGVLPDYRP